MRDYIVTYLNRFGEVEMTEVLEGSASLSLAVKIVAEKVGDHPRLYEDIKEFCLTETSVHTI